MLRKVINFCRKELGIKGQVRAIFMEDNANYGWCYHESNNRYLIGLDRRLSRDNFIKTICHEMVHVKQFETGDLIYNDRCVLWKASVWKDKNYHTLPWEIEARKIEKILYKKFKEQQC